MARYVKAIYNFDNPFEGEILLSRGDLIAIFKEINLDWYFGRNLSTNGIDGNFPSNFVEPFNLPPVKENQKLFLATENFETVIEGDLPFKKNDVIIGIMKIDNIWWKGECESKIGLFPITYVLEIPILKIDSINLQNDIKTINSNMPDNKTICSSTIPNIKKANDTSKLHKLNAKARGKAIMNFTAQFDDELGFKIGDIIDILEVKDNQFAIGCFNEHIGLFPLDFVEIFEGNLLMEMHSEEKVISKFDWWKIVNPIENNEFKEDVSNPELELNSNQKNFYSNNIDNISSMNSNGSNNGINIKNEGKYYLKNCDINQTNSVMDKSNNENISIITSNDISEIFYEETKQDKLSKSKNDNFSIITDEINENNTEHSLINSYSDDKKLDNNTLYDRLINDIYGCQAIVLHDFKAEFSNEISLKMSDIVNLAREVDKDWYEGDCNGNFGIFPKSFVKIFGSDIDSITSIEDKFIDSDINKIKNSSCLESEFNNQANPDNGYSKLESSIIVYDIDNDKYINYNIEETRNDLITKNSINETHTSLDHNSDIKESKFEHNFNPNSIIEEKTCDNLCTYTKNLNKNKLIKVCSTDISNNLHQNVSDNSIDDELKKDSIDVMNDINSNINNKITLDNIDNNINLSSHLLSNEIIFNKGDVIDEKLDDNICINYKNLNKNNLINDCLSDVSTKLLQDIGDKNIVVELKKDSEGIINDINRNMNLNISKSINLSSHLSSNENVYNKDDFIEKKRDDNICISYEDLKKENFIKVCSTDVPDKLIQNVGNNNIDDELIKDSVYVMNDINSIISSNIKNEIIFNKDDINMDNNLSNKKLPQVDVISTKKYSSYKDNIGFQNQNFNSIASTNENLKYNNNTSISEDKNILQQNKDENKSKPIIKKKPAILKKQTSFPIKIISTSKNLVNHSTSLIGSSTMNSINLEVDQKPNLDSKFTVKDLNLNKEYTNTSEVSNIDQPTVEIKKDGVIKFVNNDQNIAVGQSLFYSGTENGAALPILYPRLPPKIPKRPINTSTSIFYSFHAQDIQNPEINLIDEIEDNFKNNDNEENRFILEDLRQRINEITKDIENYETKERLLLVEISSHNQNADLKEQLNFCKLNIQGLKEEFKHLNEEVLSLTRPKVKPRKVRYQESDKDKENYLSSKENSIERTKKRKQVIDELFQTEGHFLKAVSVCYAVFYDKEQIEFCPAEFEVDVLFGNMFEVIDFSQKFYNKLESELAHKDFNTQNIGSCFCGFIEDMKNIYAMYCRNHDDVLVLLEKYEGSVEINAYISLQLNKIKSVGINVFDLRSILIKPVQRVMKYPLLINELLKSTEKDHIDYASVLMAYEKIQEVVEYINEFKRRKDLVLKYKREMDIGISERISRINFHSMLKKLNRLSMRVVLQQSVDEYFSNEELKLRNLLHFVPTLIRDIQSLCELMKESVLDREMLFAEIFDYYGEYDSLKSLKSPHWICDSLSQVIRTNINAFIDKVQTNVIPNLHNLLNTYQGPREIIKKRQHKLFDFDNAVLRLKTNQFTEQTKTLTDDVESSKRMYEALNAQLIEDLPKLCKLSRVVIGQILRLLSKYLEVVHKDIILQMESLISKVLDSDFTIDHQKAVDLFSNISFIPLSFDPLIEEKRRNKFDHNTSHPIKTQTDEVRKILLSTTDPLNIFTVLKDFPGGQLMDLPLSKGTMVAVIKREDPMRNSQRYFVNDGVEKGFILKDYLQPYPSKN